MTITEQIHLFNRLAPHEFMKLSFEMEERNLDLPIFWYVRICLKEKNEQRLTVEEIKFKEKWNHLFSRIDLSDYVFAIKHPEFTKENGDESVKNMISQLQKGFKKETRTTNSIQEALLQLLKETYQNVDFSSKDRKTKGLGINRHKFLELLNFTSEFTGHDFELKNITIKLTPKRFMHILVGHVEDYLISRKGRLITFDHISHWHEVFLLIESVIAIIEKDLERHFSGSGQDYNNTSIIVGVKKFGIHISQKGVIKTFYPFPS
jgi:hypothetical protein